MTELKIKRFQTQIQVDRIRYRVRIEDSVTTEFRSPESYIRQAFILNQIVNRPDLISCGTAKFDKMTVTHNGLCWVVEAEAEDYGYVETS